MKISEVKWDENYSDGVATIKILCPRDEIPKVLHLLDLIECGAELEVTPKKNARAK